jgi:hypothetical protein
VKLRNILSAIAVLGATMSAQAAPALTENFDNVPGLAGLGWSQVSSGTGAGSGWFQGNSGIFGSAAGAANSYAAANFVDSGTGTVSDWLMTPVLNLNSAMNVNFMSRLLGEGFLDTLEVWVSSSGASTNVADFSRLVTLTSTSDTGWTAQSINLSTLVGNVSGRVAFRFFMADNTAGDYVGIDSLSVVPEPASLALVSLALAGVAVARRRA